MGPRTLAWILPFLVVLTVLTFLRVLSLPVWATIGIHELTIFVAALLAHERLADDRPDPVYLTEFYLLLAVGGVLGGLFNALIAPILFDQGSSNIRCSSSQCCSCSPRFPKGDAQGGAAREALGPGRGRGKDTILLLVAGLAYLPLDAANGAGLWAAVVCRPDTRLHSPADALRGRYGWPARGSVLRQLKYCFADRTFLG